MLLAGDPIPHIDITVDQMPGPTRSGTTNANGEVILSGFKPGPVVVTLSHKGKKTVLGGKGQDQIILRGNASAGQKPIRIDVGRWWVNQKMSKGSLKANHNTTRSNRLAPAQADTKIPGGKGSLKANHNTTRSNRTSAQPVTASGGTSGGTRAQDYNSSRSNTTSGIEVEKDLGQDPIVEITLLAGGRLKISVVTN